MQTFDRIYQRIRYSKIHRIIDDAWLHYARGLINRLNRRYLKDHLQDDFFVDVETFCMFIGHRRSAHSIVGSLLDAHPNIVLSDELHVLRYIKAGYSKKEIFQHIVRKSRQQAEKGRKKTGRRGSKYSYFVPGQWQGKNKTIKIIGDKEGGATIDRLIATPHLLFDLKKTIDNTIKFIAVTRNPYDNISTELIKSYKNETLECRIDKYFSRCQAIADIRKNIPQEDLMFIRHDDFTRHPRHSLDSICDFLGVSTNTNYLDACARIIYRSPIKSRNEIHWPPSLITRVKKRITEFDFLEGYSYD
ncbi:MAG: sulfotransferase [Bacteroidetes bacterium]|nr:sulfotransferase [Bacteroidota bacterium]